ncbi:MAG: hypothetical protein ACI4EI_06800 [Muricoprocola sp.]
MKKDMYEDILYMEHHVSTRHPQMSMRDRAAQFAPFSALTGYGEAIAETARVTEERIELDDYEKERINEMISYLQCHVSERPRIKVVYFCPDGRKEGGGYKACEGEVQRILETERQIVLDAGTVQIEDIIDILLEE